MKKREIEERDSVRERGKMMEKKKERGMEVREKE
jgi:hypothetical protein